MNLSAFPKALARLVAALPSYPPSLGFVTAGNLIAWPALRDLDWSPVFGRCLCIQVPDTGLALYFSLQADGFHAEHGGPADVTFTATARDLARLALRLEDPDTLFFDRRLRIEGDTDLGLMVKNSLDAVELDVALAAMPIGLGSLAQRLRGLAAP